MLLHTKFEKTARAGITGIGRAIEWSKARTGQSIWSLAYGVFIVRGAWALIYELVSVYRDSNAYTPEYRARRVGSRPS